MWILGERRKTVDGFGQILSEDFRASVENELVARYRHNRSGDKQRYSLRTMGTECYLLPVAEDKRTGALLGHICRSAQHRSWGRACADYLDPVPSGSQGSCRLRKGANLGRGSGRHGPSACVGVAAVGEHAFDIETYTRSGICDLYCHIRICHTGSFLTAIEFNENL